MVVKINIPSHLAQFVDNQKSIEVEGVTVRDSLLSLALKYPSMMYEVFDINGDLAVIILHQDDPVDDSALNTPVKDGDTIELFPIIIGG